MIRLRTFQKQLTQQIAPFLITFGISLGVFALLAGETHLWDEHGITLSPSRGYGFIYSAAICLLGLLLYWRRRRIGAQIAPFDSTLCSYLLLLLFFSDWLTREYSLLQAPAIRGEILLLTALSWVLFRCASLGAKKLFFALLIPLTISLLLTQFFTSAAGAPLVSDDNASFIYRLWALKNHFPSIPYYSTLWNGGSDSRDFFATGALAPFFIFWPLIALFSPIVIYNLIISSLLFILLPLSLWCAARILGAGVIGASCAIVLGVGCGLGWYEWALSYGTLGFITAAVLFPLVIALSSIALSRDEEFSLRHAVALTTVSGLMFLWSPSMLASAPVAVFALFSWRTLYRKKYVRQIAIALFLLTAPWILIFLSVSKVGTFLTHKAESSYVQSEIQNNSAIKKKTPFTVKGTLVTLGSAAVPTNPLLVLFGLPALLMLRGGIRKLYVAIALWLTLLGALGTSLLPPQLELQRMFIFLALLCAPPVGVYLERFFLRWDERRALRPAIALSAGILLTAPLSVSGVLHNRSLMHYHFARPVFNNIARAIHTHNQGGRVLFSGFMLHQLSDAHIAPLVYLSHTPLIASSQFHNQWRYKQIFPDVFLEQKESGGIEAYLDLYNVGSVIAHEEEWQLYFHSHSELYKEVWHEAKFKLYERQHFTSNYIAKGDANLVNLEDDSVTIIPHSDEIVLKFNYLPLLTSSSSTCELSPEEITLAGVKTEIKFVKLTHCTPGEPVTIYSRSAWSRVARDTARLVIP